jgi:hypothetical protein
VCTWYLYDTDRSPDAARVQGSTDAAAAGAGGRREGDWGAEEGAEPALADASNSSHVQAVSTAEKNPPKRITEADKRKRREEERLRQEAEMTRREAMDEQRKKDDEEKMRRWEREKLEKADYVYSGERDEDGLPDGMGRCVYRHSGLIYEGEFRHGIGACRH